MRSWQPELPGITPPPAEGGALSDAAAATIAALEADGLLTPRHALSVQVVLSLSRSLDGELSRGRVSVAASNLSRQLLDAIEALPTPEVVTTDAWETLAREFAAADRAARA